MKKTFLLQGLGCASCADKMERGIAALEGVKDVTVNFLTTKMIIEADEEKMDGIISSIDKVVKGIEPDVKIKSA